PHHGRADAAHGRDASRLRRQPRAPASPHPSGGRAQGRACRGARLGAWSPAILTDQGLVPALQALAGRAPSPVRVRADAIGRLPGAVETAAYFVVSEALTNVAKHAIAAAVRITVERHDGRLLVEVADDGPGGATI